MGPLPAHSSPCAFTLHPLPLPSGFPFMLILFCSLSSFLFSLCIFILCSLPSFAFFLPYLPLSPLYILPFLDLSFLLPFLLSFLLSFYLISHSPFSFSPPFLFYFNFLNFFSFPFLLLSSSLLLLICSFFPSLCVLSAFVHHKTN